ncbi:Hsp20/alpha crystallin family protein [Cyanobium sp. Alchichica 3B3-8F6]|uniref:Hsp20/alpha crystallin family protein n=1 Tax=Cyanobium sp. Alchichica 3B3-8F6 TaxID=2823696 RepID=UPI0020CE03F8|nr:Hsp20/alpha crystallin family protein [Cyanobium sp. Alchichica 3B3-8F6]MCP9883198.1 Hsp20/alpha crystallin family protein [Cyanobium sp. Alchichica 3B3-8F6]
MLTIRQSPFDLLRSDLLEADLFKTLERQLNNADMQKAARVPAAEVHDGPEAYTIALELPGVDKASIDVKATDRTLVISAERRQPTQSEPDQAQPAPLISEIRYGTWSRSFRFPGGINRDGLEAHYRDGMLTITAPKAQTQTTVQVHVEG